MASNGGPFSRLAPQPQSMASFHWKLWVQVIGSVSVWLVAYELGIVIVSLLSPTVTMIQQRDGLVDQARHKRLRKKTLDSPYEAIWPDSHLPRWAKKSTNFDVPPKEEICFVHVGKAGGSAVGCSLGFSLHCSDTSRVKGTLSKHTTHVFHKNVYDCHDESSYFLFVVRDPIDRVRSAFNYDRPDDDDDNYHMNMFYGKGCPFYRIEDFVQRGLTETGKASYCKRVARDSLQGIAPRSRGPSHLFFNYQYYYEAVPSGAPILVIRNEHLEEDWDGLETMFRGKESRTNHEGFARNNVNTWSDEDDLYLSAESIGILCRTLCNEIQQYKTILRRAANIDKEQYRRSVEELAAKCPAEAYADSCPEPSPNISVKLQRNRGYA
ncbi:hypothetical protein ACHAXT_013001 [Thalassiosira profunda]